MGVKIGGGGGGGGGDTLPIVDTTGVVKGSADATKIVKIEADGITTGTTRTLTMPDQDVDLTPDTGTFASEAQGTTADSANTTANAALPKAGGEISGNITCAASETFDGRDLSVDGAKLDGIEAAADVTDATNVNAAGATMNTDTDVSGNSYVLDEDAMGSDSNTKVPTQQSVKAYVDDLTGTGFDMTTLSNLTVLYDATSSTNTAGKVSSLTDQSATSTHLTQAVQAAMPNLTGWAKGAVLYFDGASNSQEVSEGSTDLLNIDAAYTIGLGFMLPDLPSGDTPLAAINSTDLSTDGLIITCGDSAGTNPDFSWGSANVSHGSFLVDDLTLSPWVYYNVLIVHDGADPTIGTDFLCYINGSSLTVDAASDPTATTSTTYLGADGTNYTEVFISHFFICSAQLSAANLQSVNKKYGDLFGGGQYATIS